MRGDIGGRRDDRNTGQVRDDRGSRDQRYNDRYCIIFMQMKCTKFTLDVSS